MFTNQAKVFGVPLPLELREAVPVSALRSIVLNPERYSTAEQGRGQATERPDQQRILEGQRAGGSPPKSSRRSGCEGWPRWRREFDFRAPGRHFPARFVIDFAVRYQIVVALRRTTRWGL